MFRWFDTFGIATFIDAARTYCAPAAPHVPHWLLYSWPDAAWASAGLLLFASIWSRSENAIRHFWIFLAPALAIGGELAQLLHLLPGTFDVADSRYLLRRVCDIRHLREVHLCLRSLTGRGLTGALSPFWFLRFLPQAALIPPAHRQVAAGAPVRPPLLLLFLSPHIRRRNLIPVPVPHRTATFLCLDASMWE